MANYKIIENKERKTVTVIFGGVTFYSAKYLLELYQDERYFGNGVLELKQEELRPLLTGIAQGLNNLNDKVKNTAGQFYEGDNVDFPLIKRRKDMDDNVVPGQYELSLSVFAKGKPRNLFFADLARTKPITNEQVVKEHEWGVEIEISNYMDENTLEWKTFVVLHRIIKGKARETNYRANDSAWGGFDFGTNEEPEVGAYDNNIVEDDDLPF